MSILIHNLKQFSVNVSDIKKVFISHNHYDHNGALDFLYDLKEKIEIYVPDNVNSYKRKYQKAKIFLIPELTEIEDNVYLSGHIGSSIKEQALFLKTKSKRIIMIVGCTHPGLENFIVKAREICDVKAIIGGFHGFRKFSYLNGVDFIGACHCTANINEIKKKFPNQYKKVCVGDTYSF